MLLCGIIWLEQGLVNEQFFKICSLLQHLGSLELCFTMFLMSLFHNSVLFSVAEETEVGEG